MAKDRSHYPVRRVTLEDEGKNDDYSRFTPAERLAMVWELTKQAWIFKEGRWDEPRLDRHDVRLVRRGR